MKSSINLQKFLIYNCASRVDHYGHSLEENQIYNQFYFLKLSSQDLNTIMWNDILLANILNPNRFIQFSGLQK
jgi:hypothetical protein